MMEWMRSAFIGVVVAGPLTLFTSACGPRTLTPEGKCPIDEGLAVEQSGWPGAVDFDPSYLEGATANVLEDTLELEFTWTDGKRYRATYAFRDEECP
jgi:hypothetical protein